MILESCPPPPGIPHSIYRYLMVQIGGSISKKKFFGKKCWVLIMTLKSIKKNSRKKIEIFHKHTLQSTLLYLYFTSVGNDGGYYWLYT